MTPYEAISWALRAASITADEDPDMELCISYLRTTADHLQTAGATTDHAVKAKRDGDPDADKAAELAVHVALQLAVAAVSFLATHPFCEGVEAPKPKDMT